MKKIVFSLVSSVLVTMWSSLALAGDPFRLSNSREIGNKTQEAFETLFEQGNYRQAKEYLIEAEANKENDPLTFAMRASIAYTEDDWESLKTYAKETLKIAEEIKTTDPIRGNLYLAVGHFLEGTYIYATQDPLAAISKVPLVFDYLEAAEKINPNDPELNLIKGYLDLFLAVNFPLNTPDEAITKFENNAAPNYLVYRGIAVAYRDLDKYDFALEYVNKALSITPDNPELYYLKGQILRQRGKQTNIYQLEIALNNFDKALEKSDQLPKFILNSLNRERRKTQEKIDEIKSQASS